MLIYRISTTNVKLVSEKIKAVASLHSVQPTVKVTGTLNDSDEESAFLNEANVEIVRGKIVHPEYGQLSMTSFDDEIVWRICLNVNQARGGDTIIDIDI